MERMQCISRNITQTYSTRIAIIGKQFLGLLCCSKQSSNHEASIFVLLAMDITCCGQVTGGGVLLTMNIVCCFHRSLAVVSKVENAAAQGFYASHHHEHQVLFSGVAHTVHGF
jgi:hypothetical protein